MKKIWIPVFLIGLVFSSCVLTDDLLSMRPKKKVDETGGTVTVMQSGWFSVPESTRFSARNNHSAVSFMGSIWVTGGVDSHYKNDVWSTSDGTNWRCATTNAGFPPRGSFTMTVYQDQLWVIGGYNGYDYLSDVWSSADGTNWVRKLSNAAFGKRSDHAVTVFNGYMWLIGGAMEDMITNRIWYSSDGVNWHVSVTNAPFYVKRYISTAVYGGKMWIFGGNYFGNEICSSTDGTNWVVFSPASYSNRYKSYVEQLGGRLVLIGGHLIELAYTTNDFWTSDDGVNWNLQTETIPPNKRYGSATVIHRDSLWIMGGVTDLGITNDVWYYH